MQNMLYIAIAAVVVIALIVALILVSYVKAPPDTAFIITGAGRKKVLIGHAGLCLPLVNRMDKLLLRGRSPSISRRTATFPPRTSSALISMRSPRSQ